MMGTLLITGLDFAMVAILLTRFRAIGGWTLAEVAFLYGTSAVSFSLAEMLIGGFEDFEAWVVRGEFDQLLLRPLPITFQMITARFATRRFGRLAQGLVALGLSLVLLKPDWDAAQVLFFPVMLIGGMFLFMAIFVVGATTSFWAPQAHEAVNIFSYGGQFMTSYPMHIYQEWLVVDLHVPHPDGIHQLLPVALPARQARSARHAGLHAVPVAGRGARGLPALARALAGRACDTIRARGREQ